MLTSSASSAGRAEREHCDFRSILCERISTMKTKSLGGVFGAAMIFWWFISPPTGHWTRSSATVTVEDAESLRSDDSLKQVRTSLWIHSPYVAPGGTISAEVGAWGGHEIAVTDIGVDIAGDAVHVPGREPGWGDSMTKRKLGLFSFESGDFLGFELPVSAGVDPGDEIPLTIAVNSTAAMPAGIGFRNTPYEAVLSSSVAVTTPGRVVLYRCGQALSAAAALIVAGIVEGIGMYLALERSAERRARRRASRSEGRKSESAQRAGLTVIALVFLSPVLVWGFFYAGYSFFALPLVRATLWTNGWLTIAWLFVWAFGALEIGRRFAEWRLNRSRISRRTVGTSDATQGSR